jgi:hypothetical protein
MALEHIMPIVAFLPLSLICVEVAARRKSLLASGFLAVSVAMLLLGSNVLFALIALMIIGTYSLVEATSVARHADAQRLKEWIWALAPVALGAALGFGLGAIQLIPTLDLSSQIARQATTYNDLLDTRVPLERVQRILFPDAADFQWGNREIYHAQFFVGTATAVFALIGIFAKGALAKFSAVLCALALLYAIGTPVTAGVAAIPGLDSFRPLGRILFVFAFGIAILGAYGLDLILRKIPVGPGKFRPSAVNGVAVVVVVVTAAQLIAVSNGVMAHQPSNESSFYNQTGASEQLVESDRVVALDAGLYGSVNLALGVNNIGGYDSLVPARTVEMLRIVEGDSPHDLENEPLTRAFATRFIARSVRYDLLPAIGVTDIYVPPDSNLSKVNLGGVGSQTYAGDDGQVLTVTNAGPLVFLTNDCVLVEGKTAALEAFYQGQVTNNNVVLEADESSELAEDCSPGGYSGQVREITRSSNSVTFQYSSSKDQWLVLRESYAPGWQAVVSQAGQPDQELDVLPANVGFRAVRVPAGEGTVEFTYSPVSYQVGSWITMFSLLLTLGCIAGGVVQIVLRRRKAKATDQP